MKRKSWVANIADPHQHLSIRCIRVGSQAILNAEDTGLNHVVELNSLLHTI
jgi:hypothetical protein